MKNLEILDQLLNETKKTQKGLKKNNWFSIFTPSKKDRKIENLIKKLP
jgi:hypothetical protein